MDFAIKININFSDYLLEWQPKTKKFWSQLPKAVNLDPLRDDKFGPLILLI